MKENLFIPIERYQQDQIRRVFKRRRTFMCCWSQHIEEQQQENIISNNICGLTDEKNHT